MNLKAAKIILSLTALLGLLMFAVTIKDSESRFPQTAQSPPPATLKPVAATSVVSVGDVAKINSDGFAAIDDPAWDSMNKALQAGDRTGMADLIREGKVFVVDKGTSALVLDSGITSIKVRVQGGGQSGKAGWLPREYVSK